MRTNIEVKCFVRVRCYLSVVLWAVRKVAVEWKDCQIFDDEWCRECDVHRVRLRTFFVVRHEKHTFFGMFRVNYSQFLNNIFVAYPKRRHADFVAETPPIAFDSHCEIHIPLLSHNVTLLSVHRRSFLHFRIVRLTL
jgi:hypothetical protein